MNIAWFITFFLIISIMTLRILPFINLDASFRFQLWIREKIRQLENFLDRNDN